MKQLKTLLLISKTFENDILQIYIYIYKILRPRVPYTPILLLEKYVYYCKIINLQFRRIVAIQHVMFIYII